MDSFIRIAPIIFPLIMGLVLYYINFSKKQLNMFVTLVSLINLGILGYAITRANNAIELVRITNVFTIRLMIDEFSIIFTVIASVIWLLVSMYSIEYMEEDKKQSRFSMFFLMTLGTLIGIGFSGNLLTFYLFYEMMTFITYPLVIHNGSEKATKAGNKYIIYSLIGAQFTLIAMMGVYYFGNSLDFTTGGVLNTALVNNNEFIVLLLFVISVIGFGAKAGLYPLHAWLPIAHPVAPAPGSGVLSGVITKAGVLGIIRMTYFIFGTELIRGSWAHYITLALALISIFIGSMLAFRAKLLKVRLAYSSVSQVSYVILGVLTLNPAGLIGGLLHMVFHAVIKNSLFLSIGAVMHKTSFTRVDEMVLVGKSMPITMISFAISSLSLIGIPPLSGFISKWYLGTGSLQLPELSFGLIAVFILIISAILTAAYLLTIVAHSFFSSEGVDDARINNLEPNWVTLFPLLILALASILFGVYPRPLINFFNQIVSAVL